MTRFELGKRQDVWATITRIRYIPAPEFGKTGMSRNSFNNLSTAIRFSDQPDQQGEQSSVRY
jgi:hypothetical protein